MDKAKISEELKVVWEHYRTPALIIGAVSLFAGIIISSFI